MFNKKRILIILIVLFAVVFSYRIMHPYRQETVSQLSFTDTGGYVKINKNKSPHAAKRTYDIPDVMLVFLSNPPEHSGKVYKNIFFKKTAEKKAVLPEPAAPQDNNPLEKVNADLQQFKIFGSFKTLDDNAIFLERGREILVVRKGDKIDGKYLVKRISKQVVSLKAERINDLVHIDMENF
ncbi:MAG: hypothetical protein J7K84_00500 [Deltaproteobacteria bacterium]|nr:hypothetical protein [Deltaproteobacteria bacterium]